MATRSGRGGASNQLNELTHCTERRAPLNCSSLWGWQQLRCTSLSLQTSAPPSSAPATTVLSPILCSHSQSTQLKDNELITHQIPHAFLPSRTHICFPSRRKSSDLFATSSRNTVCVWHTVTGKELLRLVVPNLTCHAVDITPDGGAIITGAETFSAA